jgi:YesN/AraC family two-component response regulator
MANILIADDSIIMRKNLKSIITRAGHNVAGEAVNGQQAYLLYNKDTVDLVTLDITMPVMDGIEALKKILEKDPEAKVIIISALDQKRMVFQALECGAKYYIIKPITEEKIVNAISKVLNHQPQFCQQEDNQQLTVTREDDSIILKVKPNSEPLPPFTIDNMNGTFIVNINDTMNTSNVSMLDTAMKGFLFIKPLRITFNFLNTSSLHKDVIVSLAKIGSSIKEVNGEFNINGDIEDIKEYFIF